MTYPPQQPGPYGQQPPQQPSGYSGPQPAHGYVYQPLASPPPPRRNIGVILLLAVGLPLLLLGGCAAVVLVLADAGPGREAVVTEADAPVQVGPSEQPASSAPPESSAPAEEVQQRPSAAAVGGAITLEGMDAGLKVTVTVTKLANPATPAQDFKPKAGNKYVAIELTLANVGQAVYSDSPTNGAILIDGDGQQFRSTYADVREGQQFGGSATINAGDTRKGVIVFEVPESAKVATFQFALNSGFADQKGEWTLS